MRTCVEQGDRAEQLDAEIQAASQLGVTGTPTVMVDGERVDASIDAIRAAVERQTD